MKSIVKKQNRNAPVRKPVRWKPASRTGILKAPDGYRVRWCHDTAENIAKKKAEGWEILDTNKFPKASITEYEHLINDSKGLTSTVMKRNELVAMILPDEIAQERKSYYEQETADRTNDFLKNAEGKRILKNNVHSVDPATGDLVID